MLPNTPATLRLSQDVWNESPCRECFETPCCQRVPLLEMSWKTFVEFKSILHLLTYPDIEAVIKRNGMIGLFFGQKCRNLIRENGQCSLFAMETQSLVCKIYNAHLCWYRKAFENTENSHMIYMDFNRMKVLFKMLRFGDSGHIAMEPQWEDLMDLARANPCRTQHHARVIRNFPRYLSFDQLNSSSFLIFPPITKPKTLEQCDLIRFRLGFPGIFLGITDTHWFYILAANRNINLYKEILEMIPPSKEKEEFCFGFETWNNKHKADSFIGKRAILLDYEDIPTLLGSLTLSESGRITRYPGTRELLRLFKDKPPLSPGSAA